MGLQLTKHILMVGHCLRRLPNFNPSNGCLFFLVLKKTLPVISPGISLVSFSHTLWHRHRKQWASVTDVGPALKHYWFNAPCLLCLAIIGLEQCWASVSLSVETQMAVYTPNQVHAYIAYPASPRIYMRRSANVRPASQTVSQH